MFGKSGGKYCILDNPAPLVAIGETKWKWTATSIDTGAANHLVADLRKRGLATTDAILFVLNSADVELDSKPILEEVGCYLRSNSAVGLEIQGHTDDIGGAAPNLASPKNAPRR